MESFPARGKIRHYIAGRLRTKGDEAPFDDAEALITDGRLDSLDVVEMAVFLEDEFGLSFAAIGFDRGLVDSVNAILDLIKTSQVRP